jgi:hypothetical protein
VIRAAAINCAYMTFDWDRFATDPYTYDELLDRAQLLKLSVKKQVEAGYVVEQSSIDEFWSKMPPEVLKQIQPRDTDLTYQEFCDNMLAYLEGTKVAYWWSRSNTFDPIFLWRIFEDTGNLQKLHAKLKFWRVRDIRTFIDASSNFELDRNGFIPIDKKEWDAKFKEHDAKHDIVGDVLRLQTIVRLQEGL